MAASPPPGGQKPYGIVMGSDRVRQYGRTVRSQRAYVYLRGEKKPIKCCSRAHVKGSTARACGERTARWLLKERGLS